MNKYAVVTGASSGIGLAFAELLANDGYDLLLVARDKQALLETKENLSDKFNTEIAVADIDLSKPGAADELWEHTKSKDVNVLINNAGFGDLSQLADANWSKLSDMINLNIVTLTRLSQLSTQNMKSHGSGQILNVASIAAFFPGPGMATYYATKSYVLSLSEALASELKDTGVYVTALCPGPTRTGFSKAAGADKTSLFSGNLPTAMDVAEYGYKAMNQHKVVAVHGTRNKFFTLVLSRILTRRAITKAISRMQTGK